MQRRTTAKLLALALLAACGPPYALQSWTSPPTTVSADVSGFQFPETRSGGVSATPVKFKNTGRRAGLLCLHFEGESADAFEARPERVPLDTGESRTVEIRFRPHRTGRHAATLVGLLNEARARVWLAGAGYEDPAEGPHLVVEPPAIVIEYDPFGGSDPIERWLLLASVGSEAVVLAQAEAGAEMPYLQPAVDSIEVVPNQRVIPGIPPETTQSIVIRAQPEPAITTLVIESNDADHPVLEVPIAVRPRQYDCSRLLVPQVLAFHNLKDTVELHVRNPEGALACIVSTGRPNGTFVVSPAAFLAGGASEPRDVVLRGGEEWTILVEYFDPLVERATLSMTLRDDSGDSQREVLLLAESDGVCLEAADLDFGTTVQGCPPTDRTMTIRNRCASPRTLRTLSVGPEAAGFEIVGKPALPAVVAPGGVLDIAIRHTPANSNPGKTTGQLNYGGGPDLPEFSYHLTAFVAASGLVSDHFRQLARAKLDLLLVVDDTVSMADKRARLARNLARLFDALASSGIDFAIAITTTSVDAAHGGAGSGPGYVNGRLLPLDGGGPRLATADMADAVQVARANANVGAVDHATELLLRPAYLAAMSGTSGLGRPDARFEVLVISDGVDRDTISTNYYKIAFDALDSPGWSAAVSAVVPTKASAPTGCSYGEPGAGQNQRVRDLVAATGGALVDICDEDWDLESRIPLPATATNALCSAFALTRVPDVDSLRVYVDDDLVWEFDDRDMPRWWYDSQSNSVVFAPGAVPRTGALIEVQYRLGCQ